MAGIFNFLGQTDGQFQSASNMQDRGGSSIKPNIRLGAPGATPAKLFGSEGGKPKGLSIRTYSELNVMGPPSTPLPIVKSKKPQEVFEPTITQMDIDGTPISPTLKQKSFKVKDRKPISMKSSSPKSKIRRSSPILTPPFDDVFKIPLTPTVIKNNEQSSYPAPEKLAHYYDEDENYLNAEENPLDVDFEELVATFKSNIQTYDDEGFDSDPEILSYPVLPELKPYTMSPCGTRIQENSVALPNITDIEF